MTYRRQLFIAAIVLVAVANSAAAQSAKPDLNGMWGGEGRARGREHDPQGFSFERFDRPCAVTQVDCEIGSNDGKDGEFTGRLDANKPVYKPQYWDRVQYLDMNTNWQDPVFVCQPYGLPRVGVPARIIQTDKDVVFFYRQNGAGTAPADHRVIPTDGRPHDPVRAIDVTYYGDSVGKWEGDTLVIHSIGFNDLTWLDAGGYFHSEKMEVTERLRREGDKLFYDVTVEDPEVLLKPWVLETKTVNLNKNPDAYLPEGQPCKDYDSTQMVNQIRH